MKLAVNYSPQLEALLAEASCEIDIFKCPDWPDLVGKVLELGPVYVHCDLSAGDGTIGSADWNLIERLLAQTGTRYVNIHLPARPEDFPGMPVDTHDPVHLAEVANRFIRDVSVVTARFGQERVIVENVPYFGPGGHFVYPAVAPEVIGRVVAETGCGFLLDMTHAWIAAQYQGMDWKDYMSRLPVARLRELHVTGAWHDGTRWRDHFPMRSEDWEVVEWVIGRVRSREWPEPWALALEYGGIGPIFEWRSDQAVLAEQVPRLHELVSSVLSI